MQGPQGPEGAQGPRGDTGAEGPAGTTGQDAFTVTGTQSLVVDTTLPVVLPGLSTTVDVPAGSVLFITTDGGAAANSGAAGVVSSVGVHLLVDGVPIDRPFRLLNIFGPSAVMNWSIATTLELSAGPHTIEVAAALAQAASTPALMSGGAGEALQGQLSIAVINR